MTVIKGDTVVAGAVNKVNTVPMQEYLDTVIKAFSETEWEALTETQQASYKFALVYQE